MQTNLRNLLIPLTIRVRFLWDTPFGFSCTGLSASASSHLLYVSIRSAATVCYSCSLAASSSVLGSCGLGSLNPFSSANGFCSRETKVSLVSIPRELSD